MTADNLMFIGVVGFGALNVVIIFAVLFWAADRDDDGAERRTVTLRSAEGPPRLPVIAGASHRPRGDRAQPVTHERTRRERTRNAVWSGIALALICAGLLLMSSGYAFGW